MQLEGLVQAQGSASRTANHHSGSGKQKKGAAPPQANQSSFDKFDQVQVNLDGFEGRQSSVPTNNRDLKELMSQQQSTQEQTNVSNTHHSSQILNTSQNSTAGGQQQKKAKQILAQARKTSAHHHHAPGVNAINSSLPSPGALTSQGGPQQASGHQAQQIYLHSLQSSLGQTRPGSSQKPPQHSTVTHTRPTRSL